MFTKSPFKLETEALGELICHILSHSSMEDARKWREAGVSRTSEGFARYLTASVCQLATEEGSDSRIGSDRSALLTLSELEEFSKLFIEENGLLSYKEKEEAVTIRGVDESELDYLLRVFDEYSEHYRIRWEKIARSFTNPVGLEELGKSSVFSDRTLKLMGANRHISDSLGSPFSHDSYKPPSFPKLPENPAYETNRQLATFGEELQAAALLIKNMNDLAVGMAVDFKQAGDVARRWNTTMLVLGVIALFVNAGLSYWKPTPSGATSDQVAHPLKEQNHLLREQKASNIQSDE